jgi:hypothetical protein
MPWQTVNGWALLDWDAMELCSLPQEVTTETGKTTAYVQLTWKSRASAEGWLRRCYLAWAKWEKDGGGEVPANWRPRREFSPYSNGLPFPRKD